MFRRVISVAVIATIFSSAVVAQELSRIDINSNQFRVQNHARVNAIPTGYFADQSSEGAIELTEAQGSTQLQNILVIVGFATMLTAGGLITGFYLMKRRNAARQRRAPPVRLCV